MFYVTSEIYLNNDLGSLAVSVDNYPQKRKNHLTITYKIFFHFLYKFTVKTVLKCLFNITYILSMFIGIIYPDHSLVNTLLLLFKT